MTVFLAKGNFDKCSECLPQTKRMIESRVSIKFFCILFKIQQNITTLPHKKGFLI